MPHAHDLTAVAHSHDFSDRGQPRRERALVAVTLLTFTTMLLELLAGWWTGSLALQADGWHMGTHALALGGAVLAYRLARRAGAAGGYAFGGWKIEVLAAYTSALALAAVAVWLAVEGVQTLLQPRPVAYGEALLVAVVGLVVNGASLWLLSRAGVAHGHDHDHGHDHGHDHDHAHSHGHHDDHDPHHDHGQAQIEPQHHHLDAPGPAHGHDANFGAAYLHVLADALTSLLAIAALAGGAWLGWAWLDPAVALLGAAVIGHWSWGLLRRTGRALVDATADPALARAIRDRLQQDGDAQVADLHVWQVGAEAWCAAVAVVADAPLPAVRYRERLADLPSLRHVTVEVHRCPGAASPA